jgi:hypothetical protein
VRRGVGDGEAVAVVGQHDDLVRGGVADAGQQLGGRGAPTRTAADDGDARRGEQRRQTVARGDRQDRAALRRRRAPPTGVVAERGDPDAVRPAGLDAGLDRGTRVVDVDVDVPQPVAADDDERVAERRERRP